MQYIREKASHLYSFFSIIALNFNSHIQAVNMPCLVPV